MVDCKMGKVQDFIVESNGLCFICLKRNKISSDYLKHESDYEGSPNFPIHSLQSLSRFLKIDMKKVFKNPGDIDPHLLHKVVQSALKVELCDDCSILMQKFSTLYQQLEKIRLEAISSLRDIHTKFVETKEKAGQLNELDPSHEHSNNNPNNGWLEKLNILGFLRSQTIDNSSALINSSAPRIEIENLTMGMVRIKKLKLKRKPAVNFRAPPPILSPSSPHMDDTSPEIHTKNIKNECPSGDSESDDRDDSNYSDDFGMDGDNGTAPETNEEESNVSEIKVEINSPTGVDFPRHQLASRRRNDTPPILAETPHVVKVNDKYQCTVCKKLYKNRFYASQHYNSIHLKIRLKCSICRKEFANRRSYQRHYRAIHLGGVAFTCAKCNRTFTTRESLKRHQLLQSCAVPMSRKSKKCKLCDKSYSRVAALNEHVKTAHLKSLKNECNQCLKVFTRTGSLKAHIELVHKGLRKHRCNICGKRYSVKSGLTFHQATAHGHIPEIK